MVNSDASFSSDVLVEGGKISAVGPGLKVSDLLASAGLPRCPALPNAVHAGPQGCHSAGCQRQAGHARRHRPPHAPGVPLHGPGAAQCLVAVHWCVHVLTPHLHVQVAKEDFYR